MGNENHYVFITIMLIATQSVEAVLVPFRHDVMIKMLNDYRLTHGARALIYDPFLCNEAIWIAARLNLGQDVNLNTKDYGLQTYFTKEFTKASSNSLSAETMILSWYGEGIDYDYINEPEDIYKTKHFTQMLWKATTRIGLAALVTTTHTVVLVLYSPKGNIPGEFREKVGPPIPTDLPSND